MTRLSLFLRRAMLWCPIGQEEDLTETLQISSLSKIALIPLWSLT